MQHKNRISTPDIREWGTLSNCMGCSFKETFVPNATKMSFCVNCHWQSCQLPLAKFVSIAIGKVMLSTPKTAVENFLHAMDTASSELDVEHSIDSRLEHFKLCGMTTVFDVVAHSYCLHQANRFDCMHEITRETKLVAV
jgi:hypothetical protein